jgi:hypothetical protein
LSERSSIDKPRKDEHFSQHRLVPTRSKNYRYVDMILPHR